MKAVIHAGMQKTGSSSIQRTFSSLDLPGWHYPAMTPVGNLSGPWIAMFEDNPELAPAFALTGTSPAEAAMLGERWRAAFEEGLGGGDRNLLFSAERVSKTSRAAAERALTLLRRHFSDISVVAYVRPPISFMASAFQEVVRGRGENRIGGSGFWPDYRWRFEKLDSTFGRDNVRLKLFDPSRFPARDVVLDFAHEIGVDVSPDDVIRVNEGFSLEATALVFVQRRWGEGMVAGFPGAPRMNNGFVEALGRIGSSRLAFSHELVTPWIRDNRADVEWIEQRLGCAVLDEPSSSGRAVSSEDDLLAIALENAAEVASLVGDERSTDADALTRLVSDLETLRERHYTGG